MAWESRFFQQARATHQSLRCPMGRLRHCSQMSGPVQPGPLSAFRRAPRPAPAGGGCGRSGCNGSRRHGHWSSRLRKAHSLPGRSVDLRCGGRGAGFGVLWISTPCGCGGAGVYTSGRRQRCARSGNPLSPGGGVYRDPLPPLGWNVPPKTSHVSSDLEASERMM